MIHNWYSDLSTYDQMMENPEQKALIEHEGRKLAVTEYLAEKYHIHLPDDEELDRLLDNIREGS